MFERLADISSTTPDKRKYSPDTQLPLPTNKVGIEIEMEGIKNRSAIGVLTTNGYWKVKSDDSLRGQGVELVSEPLFGHDISAALQEVHAFFVGAKYKPEFNARTSLHVHMEIVDLSREELIRFMLLYCALEPVLFNYCDESRAENLYCLPVHRIEQLKKTAAGLITSLENGDKRGTSSHLRNWPKYCAFNLNNVTGIGTVEFRQMHGSIDIEEVLTWIKLLMCIKKFAVDNMTRYNDFPEIVSGFDPRMYLQGVFGDLASHVDSPVIAEQLLQGVRCAQDILLHKRLEKATAAIRQKPRKLASSLERLFNMPTASRSKKSPRLQELEAMHMAINVPGSIAPGTSFTYGSTTTSSDSEF